MVIFGAGSIGCYLGVVWAKALAAADMDLTLIGRARTFDAFRDRPIRTMSRKAGPIDATGLRLSDNVADLSSASFVILCMKATGLAQAIEDVKEHVFAHVPVISLLNGLNPVRELRAALPNHQILAGMVPFNVVWRASDQLHRSSAGAIAVERTSDSMRLSAAVQNTAAQINMSDSLEAIQRGKLLLNLINPINALSGIPLYTMLAHRPYRQIYSETVGEALATYAAAQKSWKKVGPISPKMASKLLLMPNFLFNKSVLKMQEIDENTMTSMSQDIRLRRPTEIEVLNGEIVRIGSEGQIPTPINETLVSLIHDAETSESPRQMSAPALADSLGVSLKSRR